MLALTSSSIWYTMRASGIVALVLLSATMVLGILTAGRVKSRSWPAFAQADLHKRISLLTMVFVAIHVLSAILDTYVTVGWIAVIVPFASPYRPLWTGLGTAGVDLMLALAVSSALRQRISARTWRGIHWLAYASWPVAMAHSLGMGTDAAALWMDALAGMCTLAVLGALTWRIGDLKRSTRSVTHGTPQIRTRSVIHTRAPAASLSLTSTPGDRVARPLEPNSSDRPAIQRFERNQL
jgi:sulfoxide reductase heme-binding subunit YedZ